MSSDAGNSKLALAADRHGIPDAGRPGTTGSAGFSLVEVLVTASLMAFVLLAFMASFMAGGGNVNQGGRVSRAVALAQQNIERVKNTTFPPSAGNCPGTMPAGITCTVSVSLSGTSPNRLANVTATVNWRSAQRSGNVSLVTLISE